VSRNETKPCCFVNQGSATSSQEDVAVKLSISHSGVKFCRSKNDVSKLFLGVLNVTTTESGRAAWHLPGGPAGLASRWAATAEVEVGQTTEPVNRESVGMEGEKGAR